MYVVQPHVLSRAVDETFVAFFPPTFALMLPVMQRKQGPTQYIIIRLDIRIRPVTYCSLLLHVARPLSVAECFSADPSCLPRREVRFPLRWPPVAGRSCLRVPQQWHWDEPRSAATGRSPIRNDTLERKRFSCPVWKVLFNLNYYSPHCEDPMFCWENNFPTGTLCKEFRRSNLLSVVNGSCENRLN